MDIKLQNRPHLEPIQEESEQEDEIEGSETGEGEEENYQMGVETKEVTTEDESEEDDVLRVLRPRRLSRSLSRVSFPQMQSTNNHQEEMENSSVSHEEDLRDEATPPKQANLGKEKSSRSDELRAKISKIRWQKYTPPEQPVQKKTSRKRRNKKSPVELFPEWLVDLMVNIEEAKTHQLVVE